MSGAFLRDELRERLERTKSRLETDTEKLRDITHITTLKVASHRRAERKRAKADDDDGEASPVQSAIRDKTAGKLDQTMVNFSKNVSDRRSSSVLSCHFSANRILASKDAELTDEVAKPSLRQILTVDDKYRGHPPELRRRSKEERAASKVSAPANLQSASIRYPVEEEEEEEAVGMYAPRPNRLDIEPKLRHVVSYREVHTME
eukprot:GEMP01080967.1.p1 GENE.GEMP01080967.1~~GEMP01080967.1.p1  ORF type:complete len:204 (+),score=41.53 GEMP01080967.1:114-725(+)